MIEELFEQINASHGYKMKIVPIIDIVGNQSIQLLLPCGCFQMEHSFSGKKEEIKRKFPVPDGTGYYEFCQQHLLTQQTV